MNNPGISLLKDSEWDILEGEICKVINFTPLPTGKNLPYASVVLESKKFKEEIKGFITHKQDFQHLTKAFKEKATSKNIEILIIWTRKNYKLKFLKHISSFYPKLIVWVCPKGAYELVTNPKHKPQLQGEARFFAEKPITEYKPEIMN